MAVSAGTAYLDIAPRLQKTFSRDLTRNLSAPTGQAADRAGGDAGRRFGQRFTRNTKQHVRPAVGVFRSLRGELDNAFGGRASAAIGGAVLAIGLKKTVDAASDLNETISKTRVVFGPAAAVVERFGDTAAASLGMSRQQALEAAATFGNLFVSMKIGQKPAADMSTRIVALAGDLASFNNVHPEVALEALRAGLVGETEPLRKFGINLNDAALRNEALSLGLVKTTKDVLPPAAKAQAAYSLILKQSKTAQGDFARTSDGLANQQRILAAEFKDTQAALGKELLPAMLSGVRLANRLLGGFSRLNEATGGLAAQGLLAAVGVAAVGVAVGKSITFARDARTAWVALRAAHLTTAAASTVAAGAEVQLAAATTVAGNSAMVAGGKFAGLRASLVGLGAAAAAAFVVFEVGREQIKGFQGDTTAAGDPVTWLAKQLGIWKGKAKEATDQTDLQATATDEAKKVQDAYAVALQSVGGKQAATSAKTVELTGKLKELKQGFREQVAGVRDSILAYEGLVTQSDVTAAQVVKDLNTQVRNVQTYSVDVKRLIKAGVSPAAIEELSKKGPQYVHALAVGSNRELHQYKSYWTDRQREIRTRFAGSMQLQYEGLVKKIREMQRAINRLTGKNVNISGTTSLQFTKSFTQKDWLNARLAAGRAARGMLITQGTGPTADDVPIWASKGEAVVPARSASKPEFKHWAASERIPGYALGGPVGVAQTGQAHTGVGKIMDRWGTLILAAGIKKAMAGGGSAAIKAFIRSTDPLNYGWGGAGPVVYDCSGIVSAVHGKMRNLAGAGRGLRLYTTGSIRAGIHGLKSGLGGTLQIGVTPARGHMAGRYGGLGFEAESSRTGIKVGSAASSPESFSRHFYLAKGGVIDERLVRLFEQAGADIGGDQGRMRINGKVMDAGGVLAPGLNLLANRTGRAEMVLPRGLLESSFGKPLRSWVVPWLKRIAVGVERGGRPSGGGGVRATSGSGGGGSASGRLTARQLSSLSDAQRWAYVEKYGRPPAPAGYVWAEDHTIVPRSFYNRTSYDSGGWLMPGTTVATNRTGKPERVVGPTERMPTAEEIGKVVGREVAKALREQPLQAVAYLDRQKVHRSMATEALWQDRR